MPYNFENKTALVTGAGSGIGKAAALRFGAAGASVIVSDINPDSGAATVTEIENAGGAATFVACNVADSAQVKALVDAALSHYGRLDFAFNNAGINSPVKDQWEDDVFDQSIAVNLRSIMLCMREEGRAMLESGGGAIVNTASINGIVGNAAQPAYTASKHGVVGMTKTAALRWATNGIRVNAICPGVVETAMVADVVKVPKFKAQIESMTPMGRMAKPNEIASGVMFLCSEQSSFITGHPLIIDGGATV